MADHTNDHTTYVERDRVVQEPARSNSSMAFIVGGLVVAVIVLALVFTGGDFGFDRGSTTINVEGQENAPAAVVLPEADPAPAADPAPEAAPAAEAN